MKSHIIILLYTVAACVSDQTNGQEDPISSSKVHVMQDSRHQPKYHGYEQQCPDAEDIAPCVCTYHSLFNAMDLDCSAVESEEQLKQIFKADFPLKNFRKFVIELNFNIKVLESGVFNGISFERIEILVSSLEVIELQALDSCYETATYIDMSSNEITSFPFDELSQFSKLRIFVMSGNSLSIIPADAFNGLTALQQINLNGNYANIVGTFQDLPNLRGIDLGFNDLTTVPVLFIKTGSSKLNHIYLFGNNISSVEPGAFDIVEGLDFRMWDNSLSTLDEATWRPYLEAGGTLYANKNPLICGCDLAWLFGEDPLLEQVGDDPTCNDGQNLHGLDPSIFDQC